MKNIFFFLLVITLCVNAQEGKQTDIEWPSLANSTWPMIHGNPQSNGRANVVGPQEGNVIWEVYSLFGANVGPVINSEGTIFYGGSGTDVGLFAYKDSTRLWRLKVPWIPIGLLIDSSNTIYLSNYNYNLYAIDKNGNYKWEFNAASGIESEVMGIDKDNNLYFINEDGYLFSVSKDGALNWKVFYNNGFTGSLALSPDGNNIYCSGKDSLLYSISTEGKINWKYNYGLYSMHTSYPLVDSQGNIYHRLDDKIISLSEDGNLRWSYSFDMRTSYLHSAPTIDYEGNLYLAIYNYIISLDYNGNYRWTYELPQDSLYIEEIYQPLICDKEGSIYFGSGDGGYYYSLSKDGELKWRIPLNDAEVDMTGAFDENGTLYVCVHRDEDYLAMLAIADSTSTGINDKNNVINDFELHQNFPNPFNPSTKINFTISERGNYSLKVFNSLGEVVSEILNGELNAGNHEVVFNGTELSSGVYYYQLSGKNVKVTRKMVLIK